MSAVAAESHPSGPIYWLAAPGSPSELVRTHLYSVLQKLRAAHASSETQMQSLEADVTYQCVSFSRRRVENYRRILAIHVGFCKKLWDAGEQSVDG